MEELIKALPVLRDLTVTAVMFVALVGGQRGWYVWRWTYEKDMAAKDSTIVRILAENEKWERRTMRLLNVNEGLAEKVPGV